MYTHTCIYTCRTSKGQAFLRKVYIHLHVPTHIYTCIQDKQGTSHMHTYRMNKAQALLRHVYIHSHVHTHIDTHVHKHIYTYRQDKQGTSPPPQWIHTFTCTYAYIYIHKWEARHTPSCAMYTWVYIYTQIYVHTHKISKEQAVDIHTGYARHKPSSAYTQQTSPPWHYHDMYIYLCVFVCI